MNLKFKLNLQYTNFVKVLKIFYDIENIICIPINKLMWTDNLI